MNPKKEALKYVLDDDDYDYDGSKKENRESGMTAGADAAPSSAALPNADHMAKSGGETSLSTSNDDKMAKKDDTSSLISDVVDQTTKNVPRYTSSEYDQMATSDRSSIASANSQSQLRVPMSPGAIAVEPRSSRNNSGHNNNNTTTEYTSSDGMERTGDTVTNLADIESGDGNQHQISLASGTAEGSDDDMNNNNSNNNVFGEAIQAELVVDDEQHRAQVRRQAEQDAQERLMATAVTAAEAHVVKDDVQDKLLFRKRCIFVIGIIVVVLVVVIVVSVTVGTSNGSSNSSNEPQPNSTCETAFGPLDTSGLITYQGDTVQRSGNFSGGVCQSLEYEGGYGQWYYLQGDGQKLRASTCPDDQSTSSSITNDDTSDTQILVFIDSCSSLTCVAGGDELCGGHGSVGWWATEGVGYFILVRGTRASSIGNFSLRVSPLDDNGDCSYASTVIIPDVNASSPDGISIFGSTRNQTETTAIDSHPSCRIEENTSGPSAWYTVQGDDSVENPH